MATLDVRTIMAVPATIRFVSPVRFLLRGNLQRWDHWMVGCTQWPDKMDGVIG